jgi:hypothetical protein
MFHDHPYKLLLWSLTIAVYFTGNETVHSTDEGRRPSKHNPIPHGGHFAGGKA